MINTKSVLILCGYMIASVLGAYKLQERYSWNQLDFVFPSQQLKELAVASGNYIPQNALPVGIEHWGNRLFVSVPRWKDGKNILTIIDGEDINVNACLIIDAKFLLSN